VPLHMVNHWLAKTNLLNVIDYHISYVREAYLLIGYSSILSNSREAILNSLSFVLRETSVRKPPHASTTEPTPKTFDTHTLCKHHSQFCPDITLPPPSSGNPT
jgi:hypothetical protein